MKGAPVINPRLCTNCGSCLEVAPEIFVRDPETVALLVLEKDEYPEASVLAAVTICPADCISVEGG